MDLDMNCSALLNLDKTSATYAVKSSRSDDVPSSSTNFTLSMCGKPAVSSDPRFGAMPLSVSSSAKVSNLISGKPSETSEPIKLYLDMSSGKLTIMDAHNTNFWYDEWSPFGILRCIIHGPLNLEEEILTVADLRLPNHNGIIGSGTNYPLCFLGMLPRHLLSTFESWSITHTFREANGCADLLANHARQIRCNHTVFTFH
ncbi:uncharacterized protein G2W53_002092 [Senna tora]|uniref:Uncharacterized protein n=1 Tax=Senna tora TaxID=362788 RepID=A0A834XHI5_9FABA|nr:uncharacterized protein G2W53_002092 [Senna tora]